MYRVRRLAATLLSSFLLLGLAPQIAQGQTPALPSMGVAAHLMWDYDTDAERQAVIDKMADAGVRWIRLDLSWCSLQENSRDRYSSWYVTRLDEMVAAIRARGMDILAVVYCTPGWANGHENDPWDVAAPLPPTDAADFGNVMHWLADRYRGRVAAWEIWNEPNHENFFTRNPADYVPLLKAAYPRIKQADPAATVVTGGTSYTDSTWIRRIYELGAKGYFDVMGVHPYLAPSDKGPEFDNNTMWTITAIRNVKNIMDANGDGGKKIWFTEVGWSSHSNQYAKTCYDVYQSNKDENLSDGIGCSSNGTMGVTSQVQGEYLVRMLTFVGATYPYVSNIFWYNASNKDSSIAQEANFGLLNRDLSPKPAYEMMKAFLTSQPDAVEDPGASEPTPSEPAPVTEPTSDPVTEPTPTETASPSPDPTPSPTATASGGTELQMTGGKFTQVRDGKKKPCRQRPNPRRCRSRRR